MGFEKIKKRPSVLNEEAFFTKNALWCHKACNHFFLSTLKNKLIFKNR